jgi:DNA modification methylase
MNIIYLKPSELKNYEYNNKDHPPEQIKILMDMITRFGFNSPIIIDSEYTIIAGHGRLIASMNLDLEIVPCLIKDNLTPKEVREYRLLDNRIAELATDNLENITIELEALQLDWLNELYSDIVEVDTIDAINKETIEDDVPRAPDEMIVERWDIFQLGTHILMFWDSTSPEDVKTLMSGEKASMVFTDPPYNVNYKGGGENTSNTIMNDKMSTDQFAQFLDMVFSRYQEISVEKAWVYIFHSTSTQREFQNSLEKAGFEIKNQLIWNKPMASLGWGDYRWKHEPFFYCTFKGNSANFYGDRTHGTVIDIHETKSEKDLAKAIIRSREIEKEWRTTIWSMKRENVQEYVHPTQKPVELIGYALENSSKKGEIVVDLFGGSGSTLIACEKYHRRSRIMELDPQYIQVIIKRYYEYTGIREGIRCLNRDIDLSPIL